MNKNKWYKGLRAGEGLGYGKISVDGGQGAAWCKMNLRRWEGSFEETWKCHLKMPNKQWIHWVRDPRGLLVLCHVAQPCPTFCDPMDCITPGFLVLHHLPQLAQPHVHWVYEAIQPSHPLSPLSLQTSVFPSTRVFSNELALHIRCPKYWSFSFNIHPCNEYSGLI